MTNVITVIAFLALTFDSYAQFGNQHIIDSEVFGVTKLITNDINNDGAKDIITSQKYFDNHKISLFLNTGEKDFDSQQILTSDVIQPKVAVGDLNNDGWLDIAGTSFSQGNAVYWYENNEGTFSKKAILNEDLVTPEDIEVVDIDNDGDMDIVVLGHTNIAIYYNDNSGNFTETIIPNNDFEYYAFSISDLDGDGYKDIVIGSGIVLIYMNNQGVFSTHDIARSQSIDNEGFCFLVRTADLNGDSFNDIIIDGNSQSEIRWYNNDGNGFFSFGATIENTFQCKSLSIIDVDQDGDSDIFATLWQEGEVVWYENNGSGTFGSKQIIAFSNTANAVATAVADFNNDEAQDIVWGIPLSFHINQESLGVTPVTLSNKTVNIFPNPFKEKLTIYAEADYSLDIVSCLGQYIYRDISIDKGNNDFHFQLTPQTYFLIFKSENKVPITQKLVKY